MILLLGPTGSGKSTLLKTLSVCIEGKQEQSSESEFKELPSTIPTVGTNLSSIALSKKNVVEIREVGGSLGPIWHSYYSEATRIMYVIDASNDHQISSASIQLMEVLRHNEAIPVLVILNKCDVPTKTSLIELKYLLRLEKLIESAQQTVSTVELSCKERNGITDVFKWLRTS